MKATDARQLTVDQIVDELAKLKKEQFNLRFQRATGQLENTLIFYAADNGASGEGSFRPVADVRRSARQRREQAGLRASLERSALRSDCPAMLGLVAPSQISLRSLRSLRSNNCDESDDNLRCARGHEPCASRRSRGALRPARTRHC